MVDATLDPVRAEPAMGRFPGNMAIWVGITCEFVEFGVLFAVYFVARAHFPEAFHSGPGQLSTTAGAAITLLMVTSSYFIACSVSAMRRDRRRQALMWLCAALAVALGYPLVKYLEVGRNLAQGLDGGAGIFITVYYYLTINHLVHATWGILGILFVLGRLAFGAYSAENHAGLEALGSYWHATDMIWLVLFTLFYLLA